MSSYRYKNIFLGNGNLLAPIKDRRHIFLLISLRLIWFVDLWAMLQIISLYHPIRTTAL